MLLKVEGVSKLFGGIQALDRVRLAVRRSEIHAVTGENGAGKSTLMRIIAGLESADCGEVCFSGRGIAMIHQELMTFPNLSVAENICMGQEPGRRVPGWLDRNAIARRTSELLARLGVAVDPARRMRDLSFAEQQSVEIARALAREADLIIMDEPTSSLSAHESELLFGLILDLRQRGVSTIYVSHRLPEIFRLADTITVMRDGCHVATEAAAGLNEDCLVTLMVGRPVETVAARSGSPPGEVLLEVRELTRPGRFRNISFTVRRGEILGFAGLIGAGRSDVAAAVFGLAPAAAGEILVRGRPVRIHGPDDALAAGIAMVTEDRKKYGFVPNLSVRENLLLSSLRNTPIVRAASEERVAVNEIRRFAIRAAGCEQPLRSLSGGNQQKVVIARALLADPEILILDEPTRGIDVGAKEEIYSMIQELARAGKAILLVSSEMKEILALSDRILVMREGRIVGEVRPAETSPEEILRYAMPN
jgi:ABC-type sugar transport system ATPase subunit